jgi:hypothetical protein
MNDENKNLENENLKDQLCNNAAAKKHHLLNIGLIGFVAVLTAVALTTFFMAVAANNTNGAYSIASIYILCMLLAAPTLKVFMDKTTCPIIKRAGVISEILIFAAILTLVVTICFMFVL